VHTANVFLQLKRELLPGKRTDIRVLVGAEANIIGLKGENDLPESVYRPAGTSCLWLAPLCIANEIYGQLFDLGAGQPFTKIGARLGVTTLLRLTPELFWPL